jgi:quinol monooxygenase YgiN
MAGATAARFVSSRSAARRSPGQAVIPSPALHNPASRSILRLDRDAGGDMPIYSIWESRFPAARAAEGRAVTEAIWRDMRSFVGYLSHELLVDADDPGHLLVVSQWTSRERADEVLRRYATHPNAVAANSLVAEPRRRILATRAGG